jgi:hypothetical protein
MRTIRLVRAGGQTICPYAKHRRLVLTSYAIGHS